KRVGTDILKFNTFEKEIRICIYEEITNGRKLTEIINQQHENIKYLPGHKLPHNVVAYLDVVETVKDADILLFVIPHQFIERICNAIKSHIIVFIYLLEFLSCEVAEGTFCEATVGSRNYEHGQLVKSLMQTNELRIIIKPDKEVIEVLGALENIVAFAAGFSDGLGYGNNTKAAVIRLGLKEMVKFCEEFFPAHHTEIFLKSCGVADLVATCYSGHDRKAAVAFVKTGKDIKTLEK
ncbi:unnamed protein product, partial [Rotaria sp. Silwood2]